jgi:hypothetical protein
VGLRDWAPEACLAQLRFTPGAVDLQLPQLAPGEAAAAGAKTVVIGIAAVGGGLPDSWRRTILEALNSGLDVSVVSSEQMCAEAVWWRCHRSMISDALCGKGIGVLLILDSKHSVMHPMTSPARIVQGKLSYAAAERE